MVAVDVSGKSESIDKEGEDKNHEQRYQLGVGEFVGYSNLWINDRTRKRLDTGMTGVVPSHRRRGIVTLLKLKAIEYGQRHNSERIVTSNEENNSMLALNRKLGFEPLPGWIRYEKVFQTQKQQTSASQKSASQGAKAEGAGSES